jgi:dienelactone hydrolase
MVVIASTVLLLTALPWGPHAVGFEVVALSDPARPLHGAPRPIQMSLWYPAAHASLQAMTYVDYVALLASERGPASPDEIRTAIGAHTAFLRSAAKMSDADVARWLARPMHATREATPLAGKAPLVLVAQGNDQSAADQAVLCEFLASHGFVVATSPSPVRIGQPMKTEQDIAPTAEDQALDLALLARAAGGRSFVDPERVALVGHSFGARSALLYAMRGGAAVLISLDGGIGTARGAAELRASRFFDARKATLPILHIYESLDSFMAPDFSLLRSLSAANRWIVKAQHLHHLHFTVIGDAVPQFPALASATGADRATGAASQEVLRMTLRFLQVAFDGRTPAPSRFATVFAGAERGESLTLEETLPSAVPR